MTERLFFSSSDIPLGLLVDGFPFCLDGQNWKSCEHYYQYQKFKNIDPDYARRIKECATPLLAQIMGNSSLISYNRSQWNKIKYAVMYQAQMAKITQNKVARQHLLNTYPQSLIYYSADPYWGNCKDNSGSNYLGIILIKIRENVLKALKNKRKTK